MTGAVHGELLLRAVAGPVALDDAGPEGGGELAGAVGRVRIDDQDIVAEIDRAHACLDTVGLVERDDARR
jgi:hypothetical protein